MNELITQEGGAVALPADYLAQLAQEAQNESAKETPSVSTLSFKSGIMACDKTPVPNNRMKCVVIASAYERAYYDGAYDPNKIKNPVCFHLAEDEDEEHATPNAKSSTPQHATCSGCPKNEWGSAGEGRKGKACKEIRRLAIMPTDKLSSPNDIIASEMVMAKVPVTSIKNWSNYVHRARALYNMPFWAVVADMSLRPHIKNQFEVCFDTVAAIPVMETLDAIKAKRGMAQEMLLVPYSGSPEEDTAPPVEEVKKGKKF